MPLMFFLPFAATLVSTVVVYSLMRILKESDRVVAARLVPQAARRPATQSTDFAGFR